MAGLAERFFHADERKANGHAGSYTVRRFGVGNESWGCGGAMRAEFYADQYRHFAEFLRAFNDSTRPFRIATGPNSDDYNWTEVVMREAGRMIDGLDLHYYTLVGSWEHKGSATQFGEREWLIALQHARREVVDLEAAVGGLDFRTEHVGVANVSGRGPPVFDRLERPRSAALLVEQTAEHRRAVEARQAEPVDAGVRPDKREHTAVADRAVVQRQRLACGRR